MKKGILSIIVIVAFGLGADAQDVNIPDANFKAILVNNQNINTNQDAEIQISEASAYNGIISCPSENISDLTGIEAFTSITQLHCGSNNLTSLNVSQNTAITALRCEGNKLTSLDVSQNTALTGLNCQDNLLTSLNLNGATSLQFLVCYRNNLTTLNTNSNINLESITAYKNLISSVDFSANVNLTDVHLRENKLTDIDLSTNVNLTVIALGVNSLTDLDISKNINLEELYCDDNLLTSLNAANGNNTNITDFHIIKNPNLSCIQVDDTVYSKANWIEIDAGAYFSLKCSTVGIDDQSTNISMPIYPNPASNLLTIDTDKEIKSIIIIDAFGKQVESISSTTNTINVSHLADGIYFLKVQTDKGWITKKFIKN